jgi:hypothetical protein
MLRYNIQAANTWSARARTNSLIVIITMLFLGAYSAKNMSQQLSGNYWLSSEAVIVVSKINKGHRGGPDSPWIEYRYRVNGRDYVGDQIDFGQWFYDIPYYLNKYPVGHVVTIYYDPAQPDDAVLEHSGSLFANVFLLIFAWGIAGVFGYYRFLR